MGFQFSEDIWERISLLMSVGKEETEKLDYSDEQVRHLLKVWFLTRRATKNGDRREFQVRRAWEKVDARTRHRSIRRFAPWFKYAAVLVALVGFSILWLNRADRKIDSPKTARVDFIPSGVRKAELILSNGEKIVLDTNVCREEITVAGMDFLNDDRKGKLCYRGVAQEQDTCPVAFHTLYVPKGGEYSLQLPDGSQVWLNSETTLRFPVRFADNRREIFLCGEAYFKIAKNDSLPFRVNVSEGSITVLGTSFNVSAYEEDGIWQTTLVEGKVSLEDGERQILLEPDGQYSLDRNTGKRTLCQVDTEWYTSWRNGKFYFSAYAFEEIVKKLERWYDFTMTYEDEEIKGMHFSGTIDKHRPLNDVLSFLEKTADIHFEICDRHIIARKIRKE